jgi:hypothetical protein
MLWKKMEKKMKKVYRIFAGIGGGFGGGSFQFADKFHDEAEASSNAYEAACQEYDSYEGYYGISSHAEIAEENDLDFDSDSNEIDQLYNEEKENWID